MYATGLTYEYGYEFLVRNPLDNGNHNPPGFLVQDFVTPARINVGQLDSELVMQPEHDNLNRSQYTVLIHTEITWREGR
jgi:hypothetical protein